jgi:glycosyltransferase involved in cell wall biosynthesis
MGDTTPRIATVIPLYNGAPYIVEALNSVLAQTLPPAEIIVVDDGSTDDGPAIVRRMAASHPITLLHKANGGQSSARNFGIAHCTCDLIALLDQDDIWYPNHLQELAKPFLRPRQPELGWVYSNLDEIDAEGRVVVRGCLRLSSAEHPKRDLFGCLRTDMFVLPSASLISRKAFAAVGGFDEALSGYEDDDLFLRLFRAGYDNRYIDRPLGQWRIYGTSASFSARMAVSRMTFMRKLLATCPDDPARERYIARDFIAPRFFPWLIAEYVRAAQSRNPEAIRAAFRNLQFLVRLHKFKVRVLMGMVLPWLRFPIVAVALSPAIPALRPIFRRVLR